jgi:hypothetical protein
MLAGATSSTSMLLSSWHELTVTLLEIKSLAEHRFFLLEIDESYSV